MISVVAQSARVADGHSFSVDRATIDSGETTAERFLLEWRGEADPRHVQALDTYWICTAEHGLNASTFTARIVASTAADCAACLSVGGRRAVGAAPRRCAGPRAADARCGRSVRRCRGVRARRPRPRRAADGVRPPRLPRRGSARAAAARHREGAWLASLRRGGGARAGRARGAAGEVARPSARDERRVLVGRRARRRRDPAQAGARDVRVLAHGRLVGAHPRAEAARPARQAVGALHRPRCPLARVRRVERGSRGSRRSRGARRPVRAEGARARARAAALAVGRRDRGGRARPGLPRPSPRLPRRGAVPLPAEARAAAARSRGREPGRARIGADRARSRSPAPIPATSTSSARCCTSWPLATRMPPCGVSPSSRSRTARRSATRSSSSTASPSRTTRRPT